MSTSIHIRVAGDQDAALIARLSRQTFLETFAPHNIKHDIDIFMNEQFTVDTLIKEVSEVGFIFLIAFLNNKPVGYLGLKEGNNPAGLGNLKSMEIARLYTLQKVIGKGIGKALMEKCLEIAIQMNKEVIWLGVWEYNQRAIDFYVKWGFEKFSEHDFVLGHDIQTDWIMKKSL